MVGMGKRPMNLRAILDGSALFLISVHLRAFKFFSVITTIDEQAIALNYIEFVRGRLFLSNVSVLI